VRSQLKANAKRITAMSGLTQTMTENSLARSNRKGAGMRYQQSGILDNERQPVTITAVRRKDPLLFYLGYESYHSFTVAPLTFHFRTIMPCSLFIEAVLTDY
jgi:hypothetical protein